MEFTMYKKEYETELIQHFNSGNLLLTLDKIRETEGSIYKNHYYILTLHENGIVVYKPIADSNLDRIFNQYDLIHNAMCNVLNKVIT